MSQVAMVAYFVGLVQIETGGYNCYIRFLTSVDPLGLPEYRPCPPNTAGTNPGRRFAMRNRWNGLGLVGILCLIGAPGCTTTTPLHLRRATVFPVALPRCNRGTPRPVPRQPESLQSLHARPGSAGIACSGDRTDE